MARNIPVMLGAGMLAGGLLLTLLLCQRPARAVSAKTSPPPGVGCLGCIEPAGGVLKLSAPSYLGPSLVSELRVEEGDEVTNGQILAVLDSRDRLQAAWRQAESQVKVDEAQLALVKEGAKADDIAAQRAEVGRCQAELDNAQAEYRRYETLHRNNTVSESELEARRLVFETRKQMLEQAEEKLKSLAEVRPLDVALAQARVDAAEAEADSVKAELDQAYVRAPIRGRVLKIHARPGEAVGDDGLMDLGATEQMEVTAEVYETDIGSVRVGQHAAIVADALADQTLSGVVERIGAEVGKETVFPIDPATYADARVVEVKIRLNNSAAAAGLSGARVTVRIGP